MSETITDNVITDLPVEETTELVFNKKRFAIVAAAALAVATTVIVFKWKTAQTSDDSDSE